MVGWEAVIGGMRLMNCMTWRKRVSQGYFAWSKHKLRSVEWRVWRARWALITPMMWEVVEELEDALWTPALVRIELE